MILIIIIKKQISNIEKEQVSFISEDFLCLCAEVLLFCLKTQKKRNGLINYKNAQEELNDMVAISVNQVTKTFKRYEKQERILDNFFHRKYLEKVAVDNVSFQINKGECVAVIGQNGAGKTTMMKLMSGLLLPTTGKIEVLNYNPFKKEKAYKKSITLLLGQKQQLWWDVSAKDNYLLLKDIYELRDKDYEKNLSELVEMIGAEDILQSPVRTLSLGERMKCELIGSLLYKPEILFLDEPTIGMDLIAQKEVREFIKNYSINNKATVILTSHNMGDIEAVCERAIFMDKGKIYYDGKFSEFVKEHGKDVLVSIEKRSENENILWSEYGEVLENSEGLVKLRVAKDDITILRHKLADNEYINNIMISEVGAEDIVRDFYKMEKRHENT